MPDWATAGKMLQGMGAGIQGQSPAWNRNQMLEQELEREEERRREEAKKAFDLERKRTWFLDNREAMHMLMQGDIGSVHKMAADRLQHAEQFPGEDFSDTKQLYALSSMAMQGDQEATKRLLQTVDRVDRRGVSEGMIQPIGGSADVKMQFGGDKVVSDGAGGYQVQTTRKNPKTGAVEVVTKPLPEGYAPVDQYGNTADQRIEQKRMEALATGTGSGEATRGQNVINFGYDAAKGLPVLKRSMHLLDLVETGGPDAWKVRAKQWFGLETADEAELTANMGKAVLSQLKATFGAAFTEKEGSRLERIEAGFGKSTEGNRRLIKQLMSMSEKYIGHAIARAADAQDWATVEELISLRDFEISAPPEEDEVPSGGVRFLGWE